MGGLLSRWASGLLLERCYVWLRRSSLPDQWRSTYRTQCSVGHTQTVSRVLVFRLKNVNARAETNQLRLHWLKYSVSSNSRFFVFSLLLNWIRAATLIHYSFSQRITNQVLKGAKTPCCQQSRTQRHFIHLLGKS